MRPRVLAFVVGVISLCSPAFAQQVTGVIDGDTIVVDRVGVVRLIGVDTPETNNRGEVQPFARAATGFVKQLLGGKVVRLEYDWQRQDRYNRTLAYVYLPDGTFANAEIVKQGYSPAYTKYPFKYSEQFRTFEQEARAAGRGLWDGGTPLPVAAANPAVGESGTTTVYVTRSGAKYHRAGCRSLSKSQIPISLKEAVARYEPCRNCKPPTLEKAAASAVTSPSTVTAPRRAAPQTPGDGRCQATTKKGTQCQRRARPGSNYCWQHGG